MNENTDDVWFKYYYLQTHKYEPWLCMVFGLLPRDRWIRIMITIVCVTKIVLKVHLLICYYLIIENMWPLSFKEKRYIIRGKYNSGTEVCTKL